MLQLWRARTYVTKLHQTKERKVRAVATDDVKGWWTKALEEDKKEMMRHLGFQNPK